VSVVNQVDKMSASWIVGVNVADRQAQAQEALAEALRASRERRKRADAERSAAAAELRNLIRRGVKLGMPVAELARLAGVSRETAHEALRGGRKHRHGAN
jgi:hypothetical protein